MTDNQKRSKPLLARIFSLEGAMAAFAFYSLGSGLLQGELMSVFWGVIILVGLGILVAVRRRDWKQHWDALEQQHSASRPSDRTPPEP
jgi:hypothetical protein